MEKIISILLISMSFGIIVNCGKIPSNLQSIEAVQVVENINDFLLKNPNVKLTVLNKEIPKNRNSLMGLMKVTKEPIRYTLGIPNPTDIRLAEGLNTYYYPTLQDVQLQLSYPENGIGGIVRYVEILVNQDSDIGNAYVVAGGIGEKYIRLIVEAKLVRYFSYKATFYGWL